MTHPRNRDVFDAQRRRLLSIAYRMLGSYADAEDIVQDAWLKWHACDRAELRQPAAWLTTVVTRLAIDRLRMLQTERSAREHGWLPDLWIEPVAPSAEKHVLDGAQLSYGLMLLLERLSPDERAAFLLREAFDCDYATIGAAVGKPADHCRQLMHRAKTRLCRDGALSKPADFVRQRRVVEQLRDAIATQDRDALFDALNGATVVGDTLEPVIASAHAEAIGFGDDATLAVLVDGDIVALCLPCFDARGRFVLQVVTRPAALAAANRAFGRAAIARLLARFRSTRVAAASSEVSALY